MRRISAAAGTPPGDPPAVRRVAIILNPVSGAAGRERDVARFSDVLRTKGCEPVLRPTRGPGDAPVLAREEAAAGASVIVAAGGDGTLNEVACGLRPLGDAAPPVAILPFGTSNLVARALGVPFKAERAAEVAADGLVVRLDVAEVGPRTMLACAGIGWDAHVVRALAARRKGHITFGTWLRPIWSALREYRFPRFTVTAADGTTADGVFAIVLNCAPYAAFFRPDPSARPDDGVLECLLVREATAATMVRLAWKARRGTMALDSAVTALRSTSFRVTSETPVPWQVDGDVGADTPVDILVRPGAVRLLRPRPAP